MALRDEPIKANSLNMDLDSIICVFVKEKGPKSRMDKDIDAEGKAARELTETADFFYMDLDFANMIITSSPLHLRRR